MSCASVSRKKTVAANSKLNVAMIGCGNIAGMAFGGCKNENIVALCDVDSNMLYRYEKDYSVTGEMAIYFSDRRPGGNVAHVTETLSVYIRYIWTAGYDGGAHCGCEYRSLP